MSEQYIGPESARHRYVQEITAIVHEAAALLGKPAGRKTARLWSTKPGLPPVISIDEGFMTASEARSLLRHPVVRSDWLAIKQERHNRELLHVIADAERWTWPLVERYLYDTSRDASRSDVIYHQAQYYGKNLEDDVAEYNLTVMRYMGLPYGRTIQSFMINRSDTVGTDEYIIIEAEGEILRAHTTQPEMPTLEELAALHLDLEELGRE